MVSRYNTRDPEVRRIIIDQYHKHGAEYVEKEFGVSRQSVANWKSLLATTGSLQPRFHLRGRHSELSKREIKKLENALLADPYMTNADLAAVVGNKISAQAAGNYISKSPLGFSTKLETPDVEPSFTPEVAEECTTFIKQIKKVPLGDRVYVDETWFSSGIRQRKGRFARGPSTAVPRNRKYVRHVAIAALHGNAWLHPAKIYQKGSINTADFEKYVRYQLSPHLRPEMTVLWDRRGKIRAGQESDGPTLQPKGPRIYYQNRSEAYHLTSIW
jgi:transposase